MNADARSAWASAETAARTALATAADTEHLAAARFTPIAGSLSNFGWHAVTGDAQNFVRLARDGSETLGASLVAEAAILECVAAAGIAPLVLRCDPSQRLLVTHWIDPQPTRPDLTLDRPIAQVASAMARLHRLPVASTLRRVQFEDQARALEAALPASLAEPVLLDQARAAFAQLRSGSTDLVLCHHDLHAENMVVDTAGRLWLIDWEYAGLGDPVFDLASFASQCELSPAAIETLCEHYVRAGGAVDPGRLELARWAFDYVQWLWYVGLQSTAGGSAEAVEALRRAKVIKPGLLERASAVLRCNNR